MSMPSHSGLLVHSFTRRPSDTAAPPAPVGSRELGWSLRLLRTIRIRISLYRLTFSDLDADVARRAVERAFGDKAVIDPLGDTSFGLLLIDAAAEAALNARVVAGLRRALDEIGGRAAQAGLDVAALHRSADELGDPDDVLMLLAMMPPLEASDMNADVAASATSAPTSVAA